MNPVEKRDDDLPTHRLRSNDRPRVLSAPLNNATPLLQKATDTPAGVAPTKAGARATDRPIASAHDALSGARRMPRQSFDVSINVRLMRGTVPETRGWRQASDPIQLDVRRSLAIGIRMVAGSPGRFICRNWSTEGVGKSAQWKTEGAADEARRQARATVGRRDAAGFSMRRCWRRERDSNPR